VTSLATQKAALLTWFASASGITAIWANGGGTRPAYPFAELQLTGDAVVAEDHRRGHNDLLPAGQDIELSIRQDRELVLQCRCWSKPGPYDATAEDYMKLARASLARPAVKTTLRAAGVAVAERLSNVLDISSTVNGERLLGAAMDLALNVATVETPISERGSYIDKVEGTVDIEEPLPTITIDVDASGG
jgi:hypothetical protein